MPVSRENRRQQLIDLIVDPMVMRRESIAKAAEMLCVSYHTVDAWLKPETSKSSQPVPLWALQLFILKKAAIGNEKLQVLLSKVE